jgi:arsenical pump membrane protein
MWAILGLLGLLSVVTGWLPSDAAREVAITRGAPVLGFLIAITVLAELADRAGVFDAAAYRCARLARGSSLRLFLLIAALGTVITIGMSLDTTAILLTPVVLSVTDRLGIRALPFAMLAVWLANTASLLLPVSNLTNLLALQRGHLSALGFAGRMALPELVSVLITLLYLGFLFRRDLRVRFELPETEPAQDRLTFWVCTTACLALAPGVIAGVQPWAVATPCALAAVLAFAIRGRDQLRFALLPWRIVVLTEGLFLCVTAISRHGLSTLLGDAAGTSSLRAMITAAVTSNAVNNLPSYLAIEPAVHPSQLLSVLLGTNAGPLILVWGSLATLLWRERCRARGVNVPIWKFGLIGLGGVPLVLAGSWGALLATGN